MKSIVSLLLLCLVLLVTPAVAIDTGPAAADHEVAFAFDNVAESSATVQLSFERSPTEQDSGSFESALPVTKSENCDLQPEFEKTGDPTQHWHFRSTVAKSMQNTGNLRHVHRLKYSR